MLLARLADQLHNIITKWQIHLVIKKKNEHICLRSTLSDLRAVNDALLVHDFKLIAEDIAIQFNVAKLKRFVVDFSRRVILLYFIDLFLVFFLEFLLGLVIIKILNTLFCFISFSLILSFLLLLLLFALNSKYFLYLYLFLIDFIILFFHFLDLPIRCLSLLLYPIKPILITFIFFFIQLPISS